MAQWWSIEVFHGEKEPASLWRDAYQDALTEAAVTNGALYWEWHEFQYGVIFEVCFATDEEWEAFRNLPTVRGALDAVPDPVNGLLVYRGRGGAAGSRKPRKPKPAPSAAALELEEPEEERRLNLCAAEVAFEVVRELELDPDRAEPVRQGAVAPAARTTPATHITRALPASPAGLRQQGRSSGIGTIGCRG
jgi:hypothetical protein